MDEGEMSGGKCPRANAIDPLKCMENCMQLLIKGLKYSHLEDNQVSFELLSEDPDSGNLGRIPEILTNRNKRMNLHH